MSASSNNTEKVVFTIEEEQRLIDLVREEPALFNVRHPDFKKIKLRESKWLEISEKVGRSSKFVFLVFKFDLIYPTNQSFRSHLESDCCKRWRSLRDYYKRFRGPPPSTGSSVSAIRKRNAQLAFLEDTAIIQRT